MFDSTLIEVALGLFATYALLSLLGTAIAEIIVALLNVRAKNLASAVEELLTDNQIARKFYQHPYVKNLNNDSPAKRPQSLPSRTFAQALLSAVESVASADSRPRNPRANPVNTLRATVGKITDPAMRDALITAIDSADGKIEQARDNVAQWFDAAMERVTQQYKRYTQKILLAIGLILAVAINVDTIHIASVLAHSPALREQVGSDAITAAQFWQARYDQIAEPQPLAVSVQPEAIPAAEKKLDFKAIYDDLAGLNVPIGWDEPAWDYAKERCFIFPMLGWLLTAFAVSLGAPFWFDLIAKVAPLRPSERQAEDVAAKNQPK